MKNNYKKLFAGFLVLTALASCTTNTQVSQKGHAGEQGNSMILDEAGEIARNISDRVYFDFDSSILDESAKSTLAKQAKWIADNNLSVTIEGHCDVRGPRSYNLGLGERRAHAVKTFLVASGVNAEKIHIISYGKERPAALGNTKEAHALNRRSVTVIISNK